MTLLTKATRQNYFAELGLGDYNKANIEKLQAKYLRKKDVDGVYGTNTDNLLRSLYNVKKYGKNFTITEFKCHCGGKYCTGYPAALSANVIKNLQSVRTKYGKAITVTCGLRCAPYNKMLSGSVSNSRHLQGKAIDFYQPGTTDTLAHRKTLINYIKKLPNHNYSYGNGIASNGTHPNTPNMGNAVHTDVK